MLYKGPDQDPSEYTVYLPISDDEYDWILRPWTIRQEAIIAANWAGYIPVDRRMMYQFQLNYARTFNDHNVTAMGLVKREEFARGSSLKTSARTGFLGLPTITKPNTFLKLTELTTVLNNLVLITDSTFSLRWVSAG